MKTRKGRHGMETLCGACNTWQKSAQKSCASCNAVLTDEGFAAAIQKRQAKEKKEQAAQAALLQASLLRRPEKFRIAVVNS